MEPKINACVGGTRINFGTWYSPIGKQPTDCTYCEWCVKNQCIKMDEVYDVGKVTSCNCDCPNQLDHPFIQKYDCGQHEKGGLTTCDMRQCKLCKQWIAKGEYCNECSAVFQVCYECGADAK